MRALVLILLAGFAAGDDTPVFFRKPDSQTRRALGEAFAQLKSKTRENRRTARRQIRDLGRWVTPELVHELSKSGTPLVRINLVMVITELRDGLGVKAIRGALSAKQDLARASCLALGYFGLVDDGVQLEQLLDSKKFKAKVAAPLASARIAGTMWPGEPVHADRPGTQKTIAVDLLRRSRSLPKDPREAAAILLAAVIANPETDVTPYLDDKREFVAAAAAIGLCVRPANGAQVSRLLDLLGKTADRNRAWLRALRFAALGYAPRKPDIRARLLRAVRKEKKAPRAAALLALADVPEIPVTAEVAARFERAFADSRDPAVRAAALFAWARTRSPDAFAKLARIARDDKHPLRRTAVAILLHHICTARPGDALRLLGTPKFLTEDQAALKKLVPAIRAALDKPQELARIAAEDFTDLGVGIEFSPSRRVFRIVNGFLPVLFDLDDLEDLGEAANKDFSAGAGVGIKKEDDDNGKANKGEGRGAGGAGSRAPHEVDLIDFLRTEPFFTREHVRSERPAK